MIELNFKMQLIGYYWSKDQKIYPETEYKQEAEILYKLLIKTFSEPVLNKIENSQFLEVFNSNAVFIFRNEKDDYYAFSPSEKIARISNVKYNNRSIIHIPQSLKSWFIPGEYFHENSDELYKNRLQLISGKTFYYNPSEISLSIRGNDTYIFFGKYKFALCALEQSETIEFLNEIIKQKWIYFNEEESECDSDCDGWDYSYCDMDRCKNDCETCGGRKYKCNKSCFVNRHKTVIAINISQECLMSEITKGNISLNNDRNTPFVDNLYYQLLFLKKYSTAYDNIIDDFIAKYEQLMVENLDSALKYLNDLKNLYSYVTFSDKNINESFSLSNIFNRYFFNSLKFNIKHSFFENYICYKYGINISQLLETTTILKKVENFGINEIENQKATILNSQINSAHLQNRVFT